jgi:hypothetical protein
MDKGDIPWRHHRSCFSRDGTQALLALTDDHDDRLTAASR